MHKFDYSFLVKNGINGNLVNILAYIYAMKSVADARKENFEEVYRELKKIAVVQSVKSSNAIENIITTDERIKAIVNGHSEPLNHDEQEIAGYRDVLNDIHTNYQNIALSEENILLFHEELLKLSKPDKAGKYKSEDNVIMEVRSDGSRHIRFKPIPASKTKEAMEQLVLAYLDARDNLDVNPLLLIPCFILDFLCIHPFSDGNGRMSRLLTLLLLYKSGFDASIYISFEEQINNHKDLYYEALKKSSVGFEDNKNNYYYFIENFLTTLFSCYKELDKRFATLNSKKVNKQSRIEATILNSVLPISKLEICRILPDVSPTTVELVLSNLVKDNKIIKVGAGRNTHYIKR